jgi:hypothetical protein
MPSLRSGRRVDMLKKKILTWKESNSNMYSTINTTSSEPTCVPQRNPIKIVSATQYIALANPTTSKEILAEGLGPSEL